MKILKFTLIIAIGLLSLIHFNLSAQNNYQDVVYLKNGSIIKGMIIEQIPNVSIKIQTPDQNIFVYKMDEIEKMTKEPVSIQETPVIQNNQGTSASTGKATLYIVRPDKLGFGVPFKVSCDNNYIGTTKGGQFLSVELDAGEHNIVSSSESKCEYNLKMEANKTYYLRQVVVMGVIKADNVLKILDENEGQKALSKCKPAKK
jgi:hypothetical protein